MAACRGCGCVGGRSKPERLGAGWAILIWIAFGGYVAFELWPWIPHTWLSLAVVLILGPPLWVLLGGLLEFAVGRGMELLPVRSRGEQVSRTIRVFDRVLLVGASMLAVTIALFWWLGRGG
jgi:hypothetical protein